MTQSTIGLKGTLPLKYLFLVKFFSIWCLKLVVGQIEHIKAFICVGLLFLLVRDLFSFVNISDCPPPN